MTDLGSSAAQLIEILAQVEKVIGLTSTVILVANTNLDTTVNRDTLNREDIKKIMPVYQDFIIEN